MIAKFGSGQVIADVFAGVGPFAVPAAKKGCFVLGNDLNPESSKWMQHNAELNKDAEDLFFRAFDDCEKDVDDCLARWVGVRDPKAEDCINTLFEGAENVEIDVELKDPKEVIED